MDVIQGFRLSPQQRRVWLLQRDSRALQSQCAIAIDGPLDVARLKDTVQRLIERHEILRTSFECLPGMKIPVQVTAEDVTHSLSEVDFSDQPVAERSSLVNQLFEDPLGVVDRYTLVQLSPVEHVLLISLPSLCADKQTLNNLLGEVTRLYQQSDELEETVQYAQFSAWQHELLEENDSEAGHEFWRKQTSSSAPTLKLPLESTPTDIATFTPRTHTLQLADDANGVFLFTCWQSLLRRLTKQDDIAIRYLCTGRVYEEMSDAFGLYDRWPLLHSQFDDDEPFTKVLDQIDRTVAAATEWQEYYPGGDEADDSIGFDFTERPAARVAGGLKFSIARQYSCTERMKLRLSCTRTEHALIAEFHYDPSFYSESVIENLAGQFAAVVRSAINRPDSTISELEIVGDQERQKLLVEWNATQAELDRNATIQQLFETQAALTPGALAVLYDDQQLTFDELNSRANQLARHLQSLGVSAETRVALCIERSLEMIVGLLAILKAGGAYVPLDAAQPASRLSFMLDDAHVGVLLTQESLNTLLPAHNARVVCLDTDSQAIAQHDSSNLPAPTTAQNLAYTIYTSGSTGRPKGTMIEHRSVINLLGALKRTIYANVDHALRVSVNAPLAFDSSVKQVIQLLSGHALCVIPEEVRRDGARMLRYLAEHKIDALDCTPSQLRLLLSAGLGTYDQLAVRRVLVGGEAIDAALWQELSSQDSIAYFNVYGPTECTVDTTVKHITHGDPSLGRAISNVQVYLLDERQQLVPVGMTGELCIGGEGVGRGYHDRADLTAEKFVPDPFSRKPGARLYRTGDAARFTTTGELEYAGRLDGQVKIRGSRIELGEVEVSLAAHPSVQTCAVVVRDDAQGGARLVAYVVLHESESTSAKELRTFLSEKLPDYMIPSVVMFLDAMPLTPNGKINRQALPAPGQLRPDLDEAFAAPRTPGEGILASMWEHLLGVERVGINDDFFELGGHSLLAMQLISRVREAFQIEMPLPALFAAPTVATLAVKIEEIVKAGDGLLAPPIQPVARTGHMPLSFAQVRLWFLHQLDPSSALYNLPLAIRLGGGVNISAMQLTLTEIVRRHEVLRTTYATVDGQPVQIIHEPQPFSLPIVDLSALPADQREATAQQLAMNEANTPFNLSEGPLMRVTFVKLDGDEYLALFTMHHIATDGWSMSLLTREVAALYEAFAAGAASPLPELHVQYADFAQWQRNWLRGEVLDAHLDFWKQQLDGAPPLLQLPTDRPRPPVPTFRGANLAILLPVKVTAKLKALSREEGVTLFMTVLAAFQTLLYRYTGDPDVVVGTGIAGRNRAEVEGLIGFFVNSLVLRTDLSGNPTFRELLARVREVMLGAFAHQEMPFEVLVEQLQPERNLNYNPLFQVMVIFQNTPRKASGVSGLSLSSREVEIGTSKFDLNLVITEGPERISLGLEYTTDLFDETTIQRMLSHFHNLFESICADADTRLQELALLSDEESRHLLADFNPPAPALPPAVCLHQLFEAQAASWANSTALSCDGRHLSYGELNARANRVAHHLRSLGVGPEDRVGVLLDRTPDLVVAILGILKAGAAYLPLDPSYPQERLSFMLGDAGAQVVVTKQELVDSWLLQRSEVTLVCVDDQALATASSANLYAVGVRPENAAYVIYTSGSTGQPKGVVVTHENVWRLLEVTRGDFAFDERDVWTLFHSVCFDFSVWELWGPLAFGGRLVVVPYWVSREPEAFYELLKEEKVTVLNQTPSAFRQLIKVDEEVGGELALRTVIFGGEALEMSTLRGWFERHGDERPRLVNMYGITETTVHVTYRELSARDTEGGSVIGDGLADLEVYVLDQQMRAVPEGVTGEMYVGGGGVARGYLGRAELTAQRFVPHPYSERAGARLYRTGDLARRRNDGELEYLGRIDEQVKIRGFRIELGEIANALREQAGVRECVVLALGENGEEKRIVAYVVADQEVNAGELREELKQRLPDYMIPSAIVMLDEMPLTRNGKVDRRALPVPEEVDVETDFVAPRTPVEEVLAGIWCDVLSAARVGVNDSFFDLGGHSLLATQVVSRIRAAFGVEIPVRAIFENQTVATQAFEVEQLMYQGGSLNAPPVVRTSREVELPLSFAQQRLWFIDRLTPGSPLYNMPMAVRLDGALNLAALERTLREIVRRHEVLRTNIVTVDGKPVQVIRPEAQVSEIYVPLIDLSALPKVLCEAEAKRLAHAEAVRPFDLETDSLMRTTVLRLDTKQHIAMLTFHHIIFDGWSMGVFVREVAALYNAFSQGQESPLAELPVQYADYAVWQREWLQGEVLDQQIGYWKKQLQGAPELLELPADRPRPAVQSHRGASAGLVLSKELTAQLRELCRAEGATMFMLLLATFKVLLARYTGQEDISVGTPIAGRNRVETEGLMGFFVNTLVLRTDLSGKPAMRELIRRVKEVALGAYAHQELPFEKLVDELQVERSLSHSPLFQVLFALQNAGQDVLELPGLSLSAVGETGGITKFDLMLNLSESGEAISGALVYNTDLFDSTTVKRMLMHFQMLLESVVANPDRSIASLPILAGSECQLILDNWNDTARPFPSDVCVHQLFEAQVVASPESVALICDDRRLSYGELNQRANQLAHHLRRLGVGTESPVAILMERNVDLIVSLLAILKAGGCYLPLDPDYPQERLSFMLRDANVRVLLTQSHLLERLHEHDAHTLVIDADWPTIAQETTENLTTSAHAENVAYVIYTSGSTGEPKGVEVTHRNIARLLFGVDYVRLDARPRILQMASISFDASTFEVWGALLHGGCCVLYPERVPNYEGIGKCIARHGIDVMWMTSSLFNAVVDEAPQALRGVEQLLVGGEALSVEHIRRAQNVLPEVKLTNGYGPTESTTFACCHAIEEVRADERSIPIGRAIGNTQAYILDSEMEVVGVGIKGELFLGGEGLARGYLKRSALTAERFVPNPFSERGGERLYRTGDVCRYREDGTIEYVGRADEQVKVRGFRIELGEIETVLAKAEGVAEAVVVVREQGGEKRLVAYVVGEVSASELRKYLAGRLPDYMIPGAFVVLAEMPITANGKVDKKALPEPTNERPALASEFIKPQTPAEQSIAAVWQELLHLSEVGIEDNFFDLGGNSLLLVQLHARLQKIFGEQLTMVQLFEHPTIGALAAQLSQAAPAPEQAAREASRVEKRMRGQQRQRQRLEQRKRVVTQAESSEGL
ncbi:MAG TPA: amino acid adenylation domain-containing protein [Pyrinomonadaceae bacterium]